MSGGPNGNLSRPQELEVGGCRPPYLLLLNTQIHNTQIHTYSIHKYIKTQLHNAQILNLQIQKAQILIT